MMIIEKFPHIENVHRCFSERAAILLKKPRELEAVFL